MIDVFAFLILGCIGGFLMLAALAGIFSVFMTVIVVPIAAAIGLRK